MRTTPALRFVLSILPLLMIGCATSQTVRWRENPTDAATQVAELSASRTATIKTVEGGRFWARNISFVGDSVRWAGSRDGALHKMPLAKVASIEMVVGRHAGEGAWKGALLGGGAAALGIGVGCIGETGAGESCGEYGVGGVVAVFAVLGAAVGTVVGGLFGAINADKVIFVPQD